MKLSSTLCGIALLCVALLTLSSCVVPYDEGYSSYRHHDYDHHGYSPHNGSYYGGGYHDGDHYGDCYR